MMLTAELEMRRMKCEGVFRRARSMERSCAIDREESTVLRAKVRKLLRGNAERKEKRKMKRAKKVLAVQAEAEAEEETSSVKTGHANGQARPRPPKEETSSGKTGHANGQARPRPLAPPMAARGPSHLHASRPEWRHICFFCPEEFRCVPKIPACLGKDPPNRDEHGCRCLKHCDFRPDMVFCSNKCFWQFNGSHPY